MVFKERRMFGARPETVDAPSGNADLEAEVAQTLSRAADIDASGVQVTARGGDITLTGAMGSDGEIERCRTIAASVAGVSMVRCDIVLRAGRG